MTASRLGFHSLIVALPLMAMGLATAAPLAAQSPVVGVPNPEALFTDKDPVKHKNKQAALRIMRELLQCGHWSDAGNWLTQRYIQHNPNAADGLAPVQKFFADRPRAPTCDKLTTPVVAVLAEGDLVAVVIGRTMDNPNKPGEKYTTSWFDMWRFVDGKADEHWDAATINARPIAR
jgi:predicted SnoaL-like aldol condensation-catalyzing enzyme